MNEMAKTLLLWVVIAVVLLTVFQSFNPQSASTKDVSYSEFRQAVRDKRVDEVLVHNDGRTVEAKLQDGSSVRTTALLTEKSIADIETDVRRRRALHHFRDAAFQFVARTDLHVPPFASLCDRVIAATSSAMASRVASCIWR